MTAPNRSLLRWDSVTGALLVMVSLFVLFFAARAMIGHDYIASILLVLTGLSLLRAGTELLRPAVGE